MAEHIPDTKTTGRSVKVFALAIGALLLYTAEPMLPQEECFHPALGAIIPLYIYPDLEDRDLGKPHAWQLLFAAKDALDVRRPKSQKLAIWAILGPPRTETACKDTKGGVGCTCSTFDAKYDASVGLLKDHGIRMLGYVDTGHADIKDPSVRACIRENIDTWQMHVDDYAKEPGHSTTEPIIEGIFFDNMDGVEDQAPYYAAVSDYAINGEHSFKYTVGNPGDMPTQKVADSVTTANIYEKIGFPPPCFLASTCATECYPPRPDGKKLCSDKCFADGTCHTPPLPSASSTGKFSILFHDTPAVPTAEQIQMAAQHARFIYGTDGDGNWLNSLLI